MSDSRTDEQLLSAHKAGDSQALPCLIHRYSRELHTFLARFVGNAATAEDLVQDVFVQVHTSADTFDLSRRLKPWLYTIAANKARDFLRSRRRRGDISLSASADSDYRQDPLERLGVDDRAPTDSLEEQERAAQVRRLIQSMPEHLQMILLMGYYQQMPYAEIAEALEIPIGTVKSRLHAAVQHFAKLWHENEPAPDKAVSKP
ncbi:MAG: RNA polymerase sigma factor [Phycisphaerae bacterium]